MAAPIISFPGQQPFSLANGSPNQRWIDFLLAMYNALGGNSGGGASTLLDTVSSAPGAMLFRGATLWQGLGKGPHFRVLRMGAAFPEWDLLDGNSFGPAPQNWFFAGPSSGGAANPQFRAIVTADLPALPPPDFGDQVAATFFAAPPLLNGEPSFRLILQSDIPILTPDIFGLEAANLVIAGPTTGADDYPTFRALVQADIPTLTPAIFGTEIKNTFLAGPTTGAAADPTFRALVTADLASIAGQIPGTTTNDNATAGNAGEYASSTAPNTSHVVTISNASPGVVTWAAHGLNIGSPVNFTTTGGLPTGLTVGTNYYVCSTGFAAGAFTVATSLANAFAGTPVNTSSAGSGVHTAHANAALTTTVAVDITGLTLTAGDWDVWANLATDAVVTLANGWINTASATDPSAPNQGAYASWGAQTLAAPIGQRRITVPAATTQIVHLSMLPTFAGSVNGFGFLAARRAR